MKIAETSPNLKIVVPYPNSFDTISNTSLIIRSLLPVLKEKINVEILWVLYQPEKVQLNSKNESEITTIDLHNYKNAVDLLEKEKPDLIYVSPYPEFVHYSFSIAGKFLDIPTINLLYFNSGVTYEISKKKLFISNIKNLFHKSVPNDELNNKNLFRRGKYIFFKLSFLVKTLFKIKMPFFKIISDTFYLLKFPFVKRGTLLPRFALTRHYLQNELILETYLKRNFKRSSLLVTGNPMYDKFFIKNTTSSISKKQKIKKNILIAPDSIYEAGLWTKSQRNEILTKIIQEIKTENNSFNIIVKIHPSSANLNDYKEIVNLIDPTIPIFQQGGIDDYLDQTDLVISYALQSTGLFYSLIAKKPIIICNFFNEELGSHIDKNLVSECTSPESLLTTIKNSFLENSFSEEKWSNFISKFLFRGDGLAGKRICDDILRLSKKI